MTTRSRDVRSAVCGLIVGGLSCALGACDGSEGPHGRCDRPAECCLADPVYHCLSPTDCTSSRDCPAGTVCVEDEEAEPDPAEPVCPGDVPLAACAGEGPKRCRLPSPDSTALTALTDGFGTSQFRIEVVHSDDSQAFAFDAPPETEAVVCALFACAPEVGTVGAGEDAVRRILNFDRCVVGMDVFGVSRGVFDLGGARLASSKPPPDRSTTCHGEPDFAHPWVVTELLVGCWAYDDISIVGASWLLPVDPLHVNFPNLVVASCRDNDGRSCMLDDRGHFGTCRDGSCRRRCVDAADCQTGPYLRNGGTSPDDGAGMLTPFLCDRAAGFVGECVPVGECTYQRTSRRAP